MLYCSLVAMLHQKMLVTKCMSFILFVHGSSPPPSCLPPPASLLLPPSSCLQVFVQRGSRHTLIEVVRASATLLNRLIGEEVLISATAPVGTLVVELVLTSSVS